MNKKEAIEYFGTASNLARAIGISRQAVRNWKEYPPFASQVKIDMATNGELKYEGKKETDSGMDWHPLETAPIDKQVLLASRDGGNNIFYSLAYYFPKHTKEANDYDDADQDFVADDENGIAYLKEGWYEKATYWGEVYFVHIGGTPLKWTELPKISD